jgi:hypothetical protein
MIGLFICRDFPLPPCLHRTRLFPVAEHPLHCYIGFYFLNTLPLLTVQICSRKKTVPNLIHQLPFFGNQRHLWRNEPGFWYSYFGRYWIKRGIFGSKKGIGRPDIGQASVNGSPSTVNEPRSTDIVSIIAKNIVRPRWQIYSQQPHHGLPARLAQAAGEIIYV